MTSRLFIRVAERRTFVAAQAPSRALDYSRLRFTPASL
jgi:hypothetical protein